MAISSSRPNSQSVIEEEPPLGSAEDGKVYVAVPEKLTEGIGLMRWVFQNTSSEKNIVILHVHRPAKLLPMMGAKVPASKLGEEHVRIYRAQERMMVEKSLDEYLVMCSKSKFRAKTLVFENDDVALGIVELIASHGITMLVMGAVADRHFSRKMTSPKSKIAITVKQRAAHLSCKIVFVCKGQLICTSWGKNSSLSSLAQIRSKSLPQMQHEHRSSVISPMPRSVSENAAPCKRPHRKIFPFSSYFGVPKPKSGTSADESRSLKSSRTSTVSNWLWSSNDEMNSSTRAVSKHEDDDGDSSSGTGDNLRLRNDRDEMFQRLQEARAREEDMETRVAESKHLLKEIEDKLSEAQHNLAILRTECEELKQARDNAVREAQNLRQGNGETSGGDREEAKFSVFSYSELEEATKNFDDSLKIGEGGYGSVYKGFLRHTTVAIKLLNSKGMQGKAEFRQEVEVLSKVRHPHLVALIGTCPEAWALIYEYLPQGSLDDRLTCKDETDPLPWDVRIRIAAEICSAIIFLQSNKPHGIVHGDLKPANILLDANFGSKLGDFGISRLLAHFNATQTPCCNTTPKGTLVYMDPDFLTSGDITRAADVYSFGIILLRLLTGKPALGISNQVQEAINDEKLHSMLDHSAGNWPYVLAERLAQLALKCCNAVRKKRPCLEGEVWKVLEQMVKVKERGKLLPLSCNSVLQNNNIVPSYFLCPISQEVMRDPHIAEDGFTYEAEVIRKWFKSGHNTSPMTNRKFQHHNLIPNRALLSSIQEWLQNNG